MTSRNWINQIRWHDVKNTESEAVPAFGVMLVEGRSTTDAGMVLTTGKPTSALESDPQPGRVMINGPTQIGAGLRGSGTQQWPALVQVSGSLAIGDEIGPTDSSWAMSSSGTGFVVMAIGNVLGVSTAYVSPIFSVGGAASVGYLSWYESLGNTGVAGGDPLTYSGTPSVPVEEGVVSSTGSGYVEFTAQTIGFYWVSFSAAITSSSASAGDLIGISIGDSASSTVRGVRRFESGTTENCCACGVIETTSTNEVVQVYAIAPTVGGGTTIDWEQGCLNVHFLSAS